MNDTHGETGRGWYGFDLDGTLAKYDGWKGIDHIGEPVKPMVDLIKRMHDEGKVVKVMTARIAPHKLEDGTVGEAYITVPDGEKGATRNYAHQFINDWCHFNLGFIPEIVYQKDHLMLELYDDRVKQVVPNEGWLVEEQRDMLVARLDEAVRKDLKELAAAYRSMRRSECLFWTAFGVCIAMLVVAVVQAVFAATRPGRAEAEMKPKAALSEYIEAKDSGSLPPRGPTREADPEGGSDD